VATSVDTPLKNVVETVVTMPLLFDTSTVDVTVKPSKLVTFVVFDPVIAVVTTPFVSLLAMVSTDAV
jgi:hypothetical protein